MISLSEDEWALCEEHQAYMKDKKTPPRSLHMRYMEVMTKLYCGMVLSGDVCSDPKDDDEG